MSLSYVGKIMRKRFDLNTGPLDDVHEETHVQRIRQALGAIAAREPAIFWLYPDESGAWWVRREGDETETRFGSL